MLRAPACLTSGFRPPAAPAILRRDVPPSGETMDLDLGARQRGGVDFVRARDAEQDRLCAFCGGGDGFGFSFPKRASLLSVISCSILGKIASRVQAVFTSELRDSGGADFLERFALRAQ